MKEMKTLIAYAVLCGCAPQAVVPGIPIALTPEDGLSVAESRVVDRDGRYFVEGQVDWPHSHPNRSGGVEVSVLDSDGGANWTTLYCLQHWRVKIAPGAWSDHTVRERRFRIELPSRPESGQSIAIRPFSGRCDG